MAAPSEDRQFHQNTWFRFYNFIHVVPKKLSFQDQAVIHNTYNSEASAALIDGLFLTLATENEP